ncbi:MAG TPA: hypothetical protein VMR33_19575 [Candidatus Baltobacteraceae bacterium]|jgi:hypothetical protein|nr:hypothetical protein [Candidatus Baltobacteraceae bacterium]
MKKLLTKFKLSNALDREGGGPVPDSAQENVGACAELRDFAERTAAVHRALRRRPDVAAADGTLHDSIMRVVRASAAESAPRRAPARLGFAMGAAAAVAAIGIWLAERPAAPSAPAAVSHAQTFAAAQAVLDMGGELSRTVPSAVVAPLSNEWACVDHDIRDTTRFVLAVLP